MLVCNYDLHSVFIATKLNVIIQNAIIYSEVDIIEQDLTYVLFYHFHRNYLRQLSYMYHCLVEITWHYEQVYIMLDYGQDSETLCRKWNFFFKQCGFIDILFVLKLQLYYTKLAYLMAQMSTRSDKLPRK